MNHALPPGVPSAPVNVWRAGSCSLTGRHHRVCEDALHARVTAGGGLHAAVADGVSGGASGDVAARELVTHIVAMPPIRLRHPQGPQRWLEQADAAVVRALVPYTGGAPGAATLAAAWLDADGGGFIAHVGDCRLYRWSWSGQGGLQLHALTRDQTYARYRERPPRGVPPDNPARMIGIGGLGPPEIQPLQLAAGDGLLLCSDGLHKTLDGQALAHELADRMPPANTAGGLDILARALAERAVELGSDDDVAVLLVQWQPDQGTGPSGQAPIPRT